MASHHPLAPYRFSFHLSLCLQKLTLEGHGVLKDSLTLAFYNVTSGAEFLLQLKTRGGK